MSKETRNRTKRQRRAERRELARQLREREQKLHQQAQALPLPTLAHIHTADLIREIQLRTQRLPQGVLSEVIGESKEHS